MSEEKELPKGWCWTTIEQLSTKVVDGTHHTPTYVESGIPFISVKDIRDHNIIFDDCKYISEEEHRELYKRCNPEMGDVLLSKVGTIGLTAVIHTDREFSLFVNTALIKSIREIVFSKYLSLAIRYGFVSDFYNSFINGSNQKFIGIASIASLPIPLAPYAEQYRIVSAIEQQFSRLDAGVVALQRAKAKLKRYRAAVLKAAVEGKLTETWRAEHPTTEPASLLLERILKERRAKWEADLRAKGKDPAKVKYVEPIAPDVESLPELPEEWCWATVDQLITYMRNGLPQKPETSPPGYRILRINAVRPFSVDLDEVRYLLLPQQQLEGYFIDNGDILFTRYNGSLELLGVAGLVRGCTLPTLHPDKLIRVKTVLAEPLSLYIELASNVGSSRAYLESKARTTAGQTGISGSDIRQIPIPLPSLTEQEQIVAEVERHLSLINQLEITIEANLKRAERLRQSILREAFAGRLVPQDPTDEPASVLLERIRNERNNQKNNIEASIKKNRSVKLPESVAIDVVDAEQIELWESVGN